MDQFQKRAVASLRRRHTERLQHIAKTVGDYAGYLTRDISAGRPGSHYLRDILALAQDGVLRQQALESIDEMAGIMAAGDGEDQ